MSEPLPGRPAPKLELPLVGGGRWSLADQQPENFTLVVFYRGLHCPICMGNLNDLQNKLGDFEARGVNVFVASCDTRERARKTVEDWGIGKLDVGYELRVDEARSWGLYISSAIKDEEPERFCEPGLFLIRPDRTVYACTTQSMPFARPAYDDLLGAIDFVVKNDYPPRGGVE